MAQDVYFNPTKVVFGPTAESHLADLLAQEHVTSLLFVYSGDYVNDLGIRDRVYEAAGKLGINVIENGDVVPNPRISLVRTLIEQARQHDVDFVLAAGGASSFDTAKAVAVGYNYQGDVWDIFSGKAPIGEVLHTGTISTLPGSSSEVSHVAVLQEGHDKIALEDPVLSPAFTIVNPENSRTAPYRYVISAVADLTAGYLEDYFTPDEDELLVADRVLEGGFLAAYDATLKFAQNPDSAENRLSLHWLSTVSFEDSYFAQVGRRGDWSAHRLEHALGAEFDILHGEGVATLLPHIIRRVADRRPGRYAKAAHRIFGVDLYEHSEEEAAYLLADILERYFKDLRVPTTLSEQGIKQEDLGRVVAHLEEHGQLPLGQYSPLDKEDVTAILNAAL
jgi:alcohol dehydrogenase YqhD (iron-dependent ADH family)